MGKSGGWKVAQKLEWTQAPHGPIGGNIEDIWGNKKRTKVRKHNANKFHKEAGARIASDIRNGLTLLYEHLRALTLQSRGGTRVGKISNEEASHAAYIWRTFKKQAYMLDRKEHAQLDSQTMLKEMRELINELEEGGTPGQKAQIRAGKGKGRQESSEDDDNDEEDQLAGDEEEEELADEQIKSSDAEEDEEDEEEDQGDEEEDQGDEEDHAEDEEEVEGDEEDEDDGSEEAEAHLVLTSAISQLNDGAPMMAATMSPWLEDAARELHELSMDYVDERHAVVVDRDVFPFTSQPKSASKNRRKFEKAVMGVFKEVVTRFVEDADIKEENPFDNLGSGDKGVYRSTQQKGKRKVRERLEGNDQEKARSAKRIRSADTLQKAGEAFDVTGDTQEVSPNTANPAASLENLTLMVQQSTCVLRKPIVDGLFASRLAIKDFGENPVGVALASAKLLLRHHHGGIEFHFRQTTHRDTPSIHTLNCTVGRVSIWNSLSGCRDGKDIMNYKGEARTRILWAFCEDLKNTRRAHGADHRLTFEAKERLLNIFNVLLAMEVIDGLQESKSQSPMAESASYSDRREIESSGQEEEVEALPGRSTSRRARKPTRMSSVVEDSEYEDPDDPIEHLPKRGSRKAVPKSSSSQDARVLRSASQGRSKKSKLLPQSDSDMDILEDTTAPQEEKRRGRAPKPRPAKPDTRAASRNPGPSSVPAASVVADSQEEDHLQIKQELQELVRSTRACQKAGLKSAGLVWTKSPMVAPVTLINTISACSPDALHHFSTEKAPTICATRSIQRPVDLEGNKFQGFIRLNGKRFLQRAGLVIPDWLQ
ncbi:hypothetical protein M407DRAFT_12809 [Tulasnella calospora MUT 4182]|uniref:Uncharacterized protein n=1 Tax=Tulasnella calospora MUT 4182 TaxID=1051891 RepID=A0A0C3L4C4_9AGAM|nr:hypothetical protein M407DRAFT_12809 [Tulasnella calospora MUT 4182]